jgi:hypothetical protein
MKEAMAGAGTFAKFSTHRDFICLNKKLNKTCDAAAALLDDRYSATLSRLFLLSVRFYMGWIIQSDN